MHKDSACDLQKYGVTRGKRETLNDIMNWPRKHLCYKFMLTKYCILPFLQQHEIETCPYK